MHPGVPNVGVPAIVPFDVAGDVPVDQLWQQVAALNGLDQETLHRLMQLGSVQEFPEGTVLFSEGEGHAQLYFVCTGAIRLEMATPGNRRQTILSAGPGDLLAWSSLIGDCVMTSTAIATRRSMAVVFSAEKLKSALEQDFHLGYHVMKVVARALSRRLVATRLQLLDLYHR
jgi:CRP/FNR family cyclic AMP-dependent transcriptional regulator